MVIPQFIFVVSINYLQLKTSFCFAITTSLTRLFTITFVLTFANVLCLYQLTDPALLRFSPVTTTNEVEASLPYHMSGCTIWGQAKSALQTSSIKSQKLDTTGVTIHCIQRSSQSLQCKALLTQDRDAVKLPEANKTPPIIISQANSKPNLYT